jgi:hypothetical protein
MFNFISSLFVVKRRNISLNDAKAKIQKNVADISNANHNYDLSKIHYFILIETLKDLYFSNPDRIGKKELLKLLRRARSFSKSSLHYISSIELASFTYLFNFYWE